jgi:hypothetical protein
VVAVQDTERAFKDIENFYKKNVYISKQEIANEVCHAKLEYLRTVIDNILIKVDDNRQNILLISQTQLEDFF